MRMDKAHLVGTEARGRRQPCRAAVTRQLAGTYRSISIQSATMSSQTTESRAEARRRARLAARGELPPDEPETVDAAQEQKGGFVSRLFPSAPPLAGRPDPLEGFDPSGPLRPVRERLFLLRQGWVIWIGFGLLAALGYISLRFWQDSMLGLLGTFAQFGALIAAGWFGWRRPTLYGTAAGLLGWTLYTAFLLFAFASLGAPPDTFVTPASVVSSFALEAAYWAGLGFLGGWYGGYLRRRQAHLGTRGTPPPLGGMELAPHQPRGCRRMDRRQRSMGPSLTEARARRDTNGIHRSGDDHAPAPSLTVGLQDPPY